MHSRQFDVTVQGNDEIQLKGLSLESALYYGDQGAQHSLNYGAQLYCVAANCDRIQSITLLTVSLVLRLISKYPSNKLICHSTILYSEVVLFCLRILLQIT